jgi:hypothetical protein
VWPSGWGAPSRSARRRLLAAAPFALVAIVTNLYPYREGADTELLVAAHLPVLLWFAIAYPYMGGIVRSHHRRMDFVRFTGEWIIYYALIALGGGVLMGLTALILEPTTGPELADLPPGLRRLVGDGCGHPPTALRLHLTIARPRQRGPATTQTAQDRPAVRRRHLRDRTQPLATQPQT